MDNTINLKRKEKMEEEKRFVREPNFTEEKPVGRPKMPIKRKYIVAGMIAVLAIAAIGECIAANNEWRAVFLTNNQVYFGKFWNMPFMRTIDLRDVYYLQATQPIQPAASGAQPQLQVVKLGQEIHGPKSEMHIPMNQVLFWEGLREDSALVKTIESSK